MVHPRGASEDILEAQESSTKWQAYCLIMKLEVIPHAEGQYFKQYKVQKFVISHFILHFGNCSEYSRLVLRASVNRTGPRRVFQELNCFEGWSDCLEPIHISNINGGRPRTGLGHGQLSDIGRMKKYQGDKVVYSKWHLCSCSQSRTWWLLAQDTPCNASVTAFQNSSWNGLGTTLSLWFLVWTPPVNSF